MPDNREFIAPSDEYRGTDFWMLNGRLEEAELQRQLREMKSQGITSVIARTYNGLSSDYTGPGFMKMMHGVTAEAKALGMTLFMQPRYMPGCNPQLPAKFSLGEVKAFPGGKGEGVLLDTHEAVDYCLVSSRVIVDMLDPEAMDYYIRQCYEDMWADFREYFGKTIISMWVDEPRYDSIALPWTNKLPETFKTLWGYDFPLNRIHLLFKDGEGAAVIRLHYWRTILHLLKNNYFRKVREWCHTNGLLFSGHLMSEDKMEAQIKATCCAMPLYKYFDIPGIDYLTAQMDWRDAPIKPAVSEFKRVWEYANFITPLQCSSASHQAGSEKVLCEMYGVSTENLGLRDQKYMFDCFASLGINYRSIHAFFYTLSGFTKRVFPAHIGDYQPYWPKYRTLTDTIARESWFVRQGRPKSDILVIHPMDSAFCEYRAQGAGRGQGGGNAQYNRELGRRDRAFLEMTANMTAMQLSFEFGDEETIGEDRQAHISPDGHFVVGRMEYKAVVLPEMKTIRRSTLKLLKEFMEAGGAVYALGSLPELTDGEPADLSALSDLTAVSDKSYGTTGLSANENTETQDAASASRPVILHGLIVLEDINFLPEMLGDEIRSFRYNSLEESSHIRIQCREDEEGMYYFICNDDCSRAHEGNLVVPGRYGAQRYHPENGEIKDHLCSCKDGKTIVPVSLTEGGSLLLRLRFVPEEKNDDCCQKLKLNENYGNYINGNCAEFIVREQKSEWQLRRNDPNALVIEMFRFAHEGDQLSDRAYPVLAIQEILLAEQYRGQVLLSSSFDSNIEISGCKLVVESPDQQEIRLDGRHISSEDTGHYLSRAFKTIDLPGILPGRHEITVNRYFEPRRKPALSHTALFEDLGGVDLEALMLIGSFAVKSHIERSTGVDAGSCIRINPNFTIDSEPSIVGNDITHAGYPFYAGSVSLTNLFDIDASETGKRVYFELEEVHACACEVYINDEHVGYMNWKPYRVELTGKLRQGVNRIEIRLFGSIRNLIGPWHRPTGETGHCSPKSWLGDDRENAGYIRGSSGNVKWYEERMPDQNSWTERYLLLPFGVAGARIIFAE